MKDFVILKLYNDAYKLHESLDALKLIENS